MRVGLPVWATVNGNGKDTCYTPDLDVSERDLEAGDHYISLGVLPPAESVRNKER